MALPFAAVRASVSKISGGCKGRNSSNILNPRPDFTAGFAASAVRQLERTPEFGIALGGLDDDPGVRPERHFFVASKAPWFEITDDLPQHAELLPRSEVRGA